MLNEKIKQMDQKEFELPDTVYVRDIDNRVFQSIVLECLSQIDGVSLVEGNLIDALLGRDGTDRVKGIVAEQDPKNHSVKIRVEINVYYGISLPEKAEEVQAKIAYEISRITALHVAEVHVVFKNMVSKKEIEKKEKSCCQQEEFSDEF